MHASLEDAPEVPRVCPEDPALDPWILLCRTPSMQHTPCMHVRRILHRIILCMCIYRLCVCVCVDCYSCSRINQGASKSFYSHVYLDLIRGLASFSSYAYTHCSLFRRVRSKTCPWSVATLLSS